MSTVPLRLRKLEARGKFRMHDALLMKRTSARWAICELPGLRLEQLKETSDTRRGWQVANINLPYGECMDLEVLIEDLRPDLHDGLRVWSVLHDQCFSTRQEALAAIWAAWQLIRA